MGKPKKVHPNDVPPHEFLRYVENLEIYVKILEKQLALYDVVVSLPKFEIGQNLKRLSKYFNEYTYITIDYIKNISGEYYYISTNGVWYPEDELLEY